jgi:hypothetical protein
MYFVPVTACDVLLNATAAIAFFLRAAFHHKYDSHTRTSMTRALQSPCGGEINNIYQIPEWKDGYKPTPHSITWAASNDGHGDVTYKGWLHIQGDQHNYYLGSVTNPTDFSSSVYKVDYTDDGNNSMVRGRMQDSGRTTAP